MNAASVTSELTGQALAGQTGPATGESVFGESLLCRENLNQAGDFRESYSFSFHETKREVIQKYVVHFTLQLYCV